MKPVVDQTWQWGSVGAGGLPATASLMSGGRVGGGWAGAFNLRQQSLLWPLHLSYPCCPFLLDVPKGRSKKGAKSPNFLM